MGGLMDAAAEPGLRLVDGTKPQGTRLMEGATPPAPTSVQRLLLPGDALTPLTGSRGSWTRSSKKSRVHEPIHEPVHEWRTARFPGWFPDRCRFAA